MICDVKNVVTETYSGIQKQKPTLSVAEQGPTPPSQNSEYLECLETGLTSLTST